MIISVYAGRIQNFKPFGGWKTGRGEPLTNERFPHCPMAILTTGNWQWAKKIIIRGEIRVEVHAHAHHSVAKYTLESYVCSSLLSNPLQRMDSYTFRQPCPETFQKIKFSRLCNGHKLPERHASKSHFGKLRGKSLKTLQVNFVEIHNLGAWKELNSFIRFS